MWRLMQRLAVDVRRRQKDLVLAGAQARDRCSLEATTCKAAETSGMMQDIAFCCRDPCMSWAPALRGESREVAIQGCGKVENLAV